MKSSLLLLLVLQVVTAFAFLPSSATLVGRTSHVSSRIFSTTEKEVSPFDAYQPGQTNSLVYKDVATGEGDNVAEKGDVMTVAYVGKLFPSGIQFAKNDDFVFELGEGKALPGFDDGLLGAKAGTKRSLRVPPSLAYGDRGAGPKIPPNADLEFECEVKGVARGQLQGILAKIGTTRLLGFAACFALLALAPLLG